MTDLVRIQVNAPQVEIDRWAKCAKSEHRSLSAWLRQLANDAASPSRRFKLPGAFNVKDDGDPMHSHDRTLISKLGFGDADKSNDWHDLACQYLTTEAGAVFNLKGACEGWLEQPLSKGSGKYRTTIGFVDVCGFAGMRALSEQQRKILRGARAEEDVLADEDEDEDEDVGPGAIIRAVGGRPFVIEVKIKPVGVGDILRQVALYREYANGLDCLRARCEPVGLWGVVVDFDLSDNAVHALESANVHYARLGAGFEKWLKRTATKSSKKVKTL